ncbi:MAG: hypothetical protein Greene07147_8 [Parcubacteria group bacterium Greene0714_7]|nr:MAG: hypothetical protein Greene07147_8 [Parcubacteria group bacterium Greene0714_7]
MFLMENMRRRVNRGNIEGWLILILTVLLFVSLWLFPSSFSLPSIFNNITLIANASIPEGWREFDSTKLGISILYPPGYVVDSSSVHTELGSRQGSKGVQFKIPKSYTEGNNLSHIDTGVSVEILPRVAPCTGTSFVEEGLVSKTLKEKGTTYLMTKTAGAGAGNFYEETVYVISGSVPCTAVRYFFHSTNIGNYSPGTVEAFDKQALLKEFDAIRYSLVLTR